MLVIRCDESVDGRVVAAHRRPGGGDFPFLGRRLEPARGPHGGQQARQLCAEGLRRRQQGAQRLDLDGWDQFREGHPLPMDIVAEERRRDRGDRARLGRRNLRPHPLHQIVAEQTKGTRKHRALRRGATPRRALKDCGELLKDPLNPPAGSIEGAQLVGRALCRIEQIGEQTYRLLARARQR